jgi:hypothetical protein
MTTLAIHEDERCLPTARFVGRLHHAADQSTGSSRGMAAYDSPRPSGPVKGMRTQADLFVDAGGNRHRRPQAS